MERQYICECCIDELRTKIESYRNVIDDLFEHLDDAVIELAARNFSEDE